MTTQPRKHKERITMTMARLREDKPTPVRCEKHVWGSIDFHGHQCHKKAVVEREGKHYCKLHDPIAMKAKADASMAAYDQKWAAVGQKNKEIQRKLNAYDTLVEAAQLAYGVLSGQLGGQEQKHLITEKLKAALAMAKGEAQA